MNTVFQLKNVTVAFEKQAIRHRSLKYALASLMRGTPRPRLHALADVSLRIDEGDAVGIIGRNGAGKSTLLRVLTGVITPQDGQVHRNTRKHVLPLLELGIGFQPDLSGRENCRLAGILMGHSRAEIDARIEGIARFADLREFLDEPVKNYSSGMYARLGFSLVTDEQPEVLIVDEVFGVGDEFFMRKCILRMQRLMQQGTTTVLVSHNIDFLVTQCRRLIWLEKGRIAMDGTPAAVAAAYRTSETTQE